MRILLVDDDRDSRVAVGWFLKDQGHEIVECDNGEEALTHVALGNFPMVLTDVKMPGMSGIDLLATIKKMPDRRDTPVVLYTGFAEGKAVDEAFSAGAYDFLMKPMEAADLAAVIDRLMEHYAFSPETA